MTAPGTCVDCGNEAYIRLAGEPETMICAHCFAARTPPATAKPATDPATPARASARSSRGR